MDFETALSQLEAIVSELESGKLGLEESLARFDEAMKLREFCAKKLREAEAKIEEYAVRAEAATGAEEMEDEDLEEGEEESGQSRLLDEP